MCRTNAFIGFEARRAGISVLSWCAFVFESYAAPNRAGQTLRLFFYRYVGPMGLEC